MAVRRLSGTWYPPGSAARRLAILHSDGLYYRLEVEDGTRRDGDFRQVQVSDRVGDIPRRLVLPDGSLFETPDNAGVDALLQRGSHRDGRGGIVHRLESRRSWIVLALLLTLSVTFAAVWWGVPWASRALAQALPASVNQSLSQGALELLDQWVFEPSALPEARRDAIRRRVHQRLLPDDSEGLRYRLHFRQAGGMANALALPSGDIVLTDALVALAGDPAEIDAVLLHEIGHVVHRHGLQSVIRSSFLGIGLLLVVGDVNAINSLAAALPAFLLEGHHSRQAESEADDYALTRMLQLGEDPEAFARILEKLEAVAGDAAGNKDQVRLRSYLSTHPLTEERVAHARALARGARH
ncbi:peptidase M48 [endosymbiont of unidentified scaly snail isolate Monju]|nr:peptidase M48 [endosymbiont of unidentified scaly snail isolate Monju]